MSTKSTVIDYTPYVYAIREQVEQHSDALAELSTTLKARPLSFIERTAAERSLQVLVEAAIGCSKQYLKKTNAPIPSEALTSILRCYERLSITEPEEESLRGAVGMRNVIVHDYLNIDWAKIEQVVLNEKYQDVLKYIEIVLEELI